MQNITHTKLADIDTASENWTGGIGQYIKQINAAILGSTDPIRRQLLSNTGQLSRKPFQHSSEYGLCWATSAMETPTESRVLPFTICTPSLPHAAKCFSLALSNSLILVPLNPPSLSFLHTPLNQKRRLRPLSYVRASVISDFWVGIQHIMLRNAKYIWGQREQGE